MIIPRMSRDEYDAIEAVNGSLLRTAFVNGELSMRELRAHMLGQKKLSSPDLVLGNAIHVRLLEPERYSKIPVIDRCSATTGKQTRCKNVGRFYHDCLWWCGVDGHAPDGAIEPEGAITKEDAVAVEGVVESMRKCPVVKFFSHSGGIEETLTWDQHVEYEVGGETRHRVLPMKARLDKLVMPYTAVSGRRVGSFDVDIKTVQCGGHTEQKFFRSVDDHGYDLQFAIHRAGLRANDPETFKDCAFVWLAVEKKPPYDVAAWDAMHWLDSGERKLQRVLAAYCASLDTGEWPGIQGGMREIPRLPFPKYLEDR